MPEVKWIKIKTNFLDGTSFKYMRRAKVEGVADFRDKLESVWFELLGLAGKVNNEGFLYNDEIAFKTYEDIAIVLDRTEKEIELCMKFYIQQNMVEIIDSYLCLSNWTKYQNVEGLEKIRESNRLRQQRHRALCVSRDSNVTGNVTVTLPSQDNNISISKSNSESVVKENSKEEGKEVTKRFTPPTTEEVKSYCESRHNNIDPEKFINFYESKGWMIGKNKMKDWKAAVRTWEKGNYSGDKQSHVNDGIPQLGECL